MNQNLNQLIDEILRFLWADSPVFATYVGIHDYDAELDKLCPERRTASITKKKEYRQKLDQFLQNKDIVLEGNEKLDINILRNTLATDIELQEKHKRVMRDSSVYPQIALTAIYILLLRDFAPLETRAQSVLSRLRQVPRLVDEGIQNLQHGDNIPQIWTTIGIEITQSGMAFFTGMIPSFAEKSGNLKDDILTANQAAVDAFHKFLDFQQNELLPRSTGNFAVGQSIFQYLLDHEHQLPYTIDELLQMGQEQIRFTQEKMYQISRRMDPTVNWRNQIKEAKKEHPAANELLDFYRQTMEETRSFVQEKNLVTIPQNQSLQVMETPVFERPTVPYAAYVPPACFETKQEGLFWVTPVDETKKAPEKEEQLQGHSIYSIPITVSHEGYPGHHLQLCHANKIESKVRKQFGTTVFIEGWALYCEELMWEHGFYTDARIRLMQLNDILWRACRVVIDIQLHTGNMTFDEAVDMLVKTASLEKVNAITEVKRYTQSPTQPLSYLAGKMAIMGLREDYKKKLGDKFNLKEFHDKLISFGSIPIKLVREELLK